MRLVQLQNGQWLNAADIRTVEAWPSSGDTWRVEVTLVSTGDAIVANGLTEQRAEKEKEKLVMWLAWRGEQIEPGYEAAWAEWSLRKRVV